MMTLDTLDENIFLGERERKDAGGYSVCKRVREISSCRHRRRERGRGGMVAAPIF